MRKFDAAASLFSAAGTGAVAPATGIERSRGMLQHRSSDLARVMAERRESNARQSEHDDSVAQYDTTAMLSACPAGSALEEVSDASVSSVRSSDVSTDSDSHAVDEASSSTTAATVRQMTPYGTDAGDDDIATMDIALVRERLAALEHASSPTQAEIDAMLAQYSDYASSSSSRSSSRRSSVGEGDDRSSSAGSTTTGSATATPTDPHDHLLPQHEGAHETVIMKVLVVGNARCGKTSTIRQFVSREFSETYVSTIGADFVEKTIRYDAALTVSLQLWDIAGQDRFAKLTRAYFRDAAGALIVCDITRENTVDAVETWKRELDTCARDLVRRAPDSSGSDDETPLPVVMVANKSDLLTDVASALTIGVNMQKCVAKLGILEWFRTSAKRGDSVDDAFACLLDRMVATHRAAKAQQLRRAQEDRACADDGDSNEHCDNDSQDASRGSPYKHRGAGTNDDHRVIRLTQLPPLSYDNTGGFGCDCN